MASRQRIEVVLVYKLKKAHQGTVRRHYMEWRHGKGLPERCDNSNCTFHTNALIWNGERLPLVLDHIDGNHKNNSPENLRLLCPLCNSQQPTHGGKNKGRIQSQTEQGYQVVNRDGRRDANFFAKGGVTITGHAEVRVELSGNKETA